MRLYSYFTILIAGCLCTSLSLPGYAQYDSIGLIAFRQKQLEKLTSGPGSPLNSREAKGLSYFPANEQFRFEAMMLPLSGEDVVLFPTSSGKTKRYKAYAKLIFRYGQDAESGKSLLHELTVYEMEGAASHPLYGDHLFLPFLDRSNGTHTYGGGRYIDMSRRALEAGDYVLDFNLAYNPWCAYSPNFNCPIPPENNRLSFEVLAGEASFAEEAASIK